MIHISEISFWVPFPTLPCQKHLLGDLFDTISIQNSKVMHSEAPQVAAVLSRTLILPTEESKAPGTQCTFLPLVRSTCCVWFRSWEYTKDESQGYAYLKKPFYSCTSIVVELTSWSGHRVLSLKIFFHQCQKQNSRFPRK